MGADGVAQVARTVAVINNKGGVGKTTASKALCEGMAERGLNVLLIDMDAQANITTWLKAETSPDCLTVFNLLEKPKTPLSDCVQFMDGCDIIAGDIAMKDLDSVLSQGLGRELRLKRALEPAMDVYDYIVIDCPPSLGLATLNALVAVDDVVIVTEPSMFSINGFGNVYDLVESIKTDYAFNPDLNIDGILLNKYSKDEVASRAADEQLPAIAELGHTRLYAARPMKHKAIEDAANNKEPLFGFRPNDAAVAEFRKFVGEYLGGE